MAGVSSNAQQIALLINQTAHLLRIFWVKCTHYKIPDAPWYVTKMQAPVILEMAHTLLGRLLDSNHRQEQTPSQMWNPCRLEGSQVHNASLRQPPHFLWYSLEVFSEAMIFHSCLELCTVAFGERLPEELVLICLWSFSRGGFFCKIKRQLQKPSQRLHLLLPSPLSANAERFKRTPCLHLCTPTVQPEITANS